MNPSDRQSIIGRVEQVRAALHLHKSQFAARIGLKPQTYSNFVCKQASKPSVELLVGLVKVFDVNPLWLLLGNTDSPMFMPPPQVVDFSKITKAEIDEAMKEGFGPPQIFYDGSHIVLGKLNEVLDGLTELRKEVSDFRRAITKEPEAPRPLPMEPSGPNPLPRYP